MPANALPQALASVANIFRNRNNKAAFRSFHAVDCAFDESKCITRFPVAW